MKTGYGTVTMESKMKEINERKAAELENKIQQLESKLLVAGDPETKGEEKKESNIGPIVKRVLLLQVLPGIATGALMAVGYHCMSGLLNTYFPINTPQPGLSDGGFQPKIIDATNVNVQ